MSASRYSSPKPIGVLNGPLSATVPSVATICSPHRPLWLRCHAVTTCTKDATYNTCKQHTNVLYVRKVPSTWSCSGGNWTKQLRASRCRHSSPILKLSSIAMTAPQNLPSNTIGWEASVRPAIPTIRTRFSCWADLISSSILRPYHGLASVAATVYSSRLYQGGQELKAAARVLTFSTARIQHLTVHDPHRLCH